MLLNQALTIAEAESTGTASHFQTVIDIELRLSRVEAELRALYIEDLEIINLKILCYDYLERYRTCSRFEY